MPVSRCAADDYQRRVEHVLAQTPLIDGHNDLPWEIRERFKSDLATVDLKSDTRLLPIPADAAPLMTDIPRLRAGLVGGGSIAPDVRRRRALHDVDTHARQCVGGLGH
jgi:hypothetical protein